MSETINIVVVDKKFETQALQGLVIRSEGNANTIKIQFPKTYESEDLTTKMFILKCTNANGIYFETLLQKNVKTDYIELTWVVEPVFTTVSGILKVAIFAESANYSLGTTMSKVIVEESPQIMVPIDQFTVFEQYLKEIRVAADSTESYYEQTLAIKNDFESKIVDGLTSEDPKKILSANQGRVLNTRINNIVGQTGNSNTEIVDARNSPERNTIYATLKDRLDAVDGDIVKSKFSAPATATAPIISLPSTVVKGKMEGSLKGNTLYNAVVNGDFSNGTNRWNIQQGTHTVNNKIYSSVGNGSGVNVQALQETKIPYKTGNKIFVKYTFRLTNASCTSVKAFITDKSGSNPRDIFILPSPTQNQIYTMYGVVSCTIDSTNIRIFIRHTYPDAVTANGKVMEVDGNVGVFAIPITGTPYENWTADQINTMIDGYWEGLGGTSEVGVRAIGKNLFDKSKVTLNFQINGSTGLISASPVNSATDFIKVKPNTQYTLSGGREGGGTAGNAYYDSNKNYISGFTQNLSATTITTPSNCAYIRSSITSTKVDTFILNEGSTALPYEPYTETELFAPVKLNRLPNNVADEFTLDGRYIQRTAEKTSQSGVVNYADMATGGSFIAQLADGTMQTGVKGATLTATATKIIYQLATPIETQYPASNLIAEPSGTIYVDSAVTLTKQYKTGISVTNKIKSLNSVFMVNENVKTPINLSLVSVASDGMSLTILNANATNFYEINYETFGAILPTIEYSYPSNLAGAVLANTESIKEIDLTLESFIALQNAMNVEFDFRLTTGGH